MSKLRLCLLTHTLPRFEGDPSAPFIGELSDALSKNTKVFVLAPDDTAFRSQLKRNYSLFLYRYMYPQKLQTLGYSRTLKGDRSMSFSAYLLSPFLCLFATMALVRLIRKEKIDLISAHWLLPNGFVAYLASSLTGTPYTVTIPGSDVYMGFKNPVFKWMIGLTVKKAAWVISDSRYYIERLGELGFKHSRSSVIRYGVNSEKFKITPKKKELLNHYGLADEDIIVVAVGRMVAKKGFLYLIKALPVVTKCYPRLKVLLVGDGEERKKLENLVLKLGLDKKVIFAGTVPFTKLADYYNLGDIFIMPSVKDNSGNVDASPVAMMEAMTCGLPVIGTKYAAGDTSFPLPLMGKVVSEKDSQAIAKAILGLVKSAGKIDKSKVGQLAKKYYSLDQTAKSYLDIFENVLLN